MTKKVESSKTFGLIDNSLIFSGHPADYYLQDPLSRDIQHYIRRIVTKNIYREGSVAHLKLSSTGAVQFHYKTADDESIQTAIFADTKSIIFPPWQSKPSSPITFIDQGKVTKAEVGSASTNQKESGNVNFAFIGQQPLQTPKPDGFFIWIHPDIEILPDSVTVIPFSEVTFDISNAEITTRLAPPSETPPSKITPLISPSHDDEEQLDLSLLFKDD